MHMLGKRFDNAVGGEGRGVSTCVSFRTGALV